MIDGFNINCGKDKVITLKRGIFSIGCFRGTYKEAKKTILAKYEGNDAVQFISKLDGAIDMKWFTDEVHNKLKDHEDWKIRLAVAEYSDKYHEELKNDEFWGVRLEVAKCSDKYHEELKNDADWGIRYAVAKYSDRYHDELKNDKDYDVRDAVAEYSDKYHEELKNDED